MTVVSPPSAALLAWLRTVTVRRLEFVHGGDAANLSCQGYSSWEQRYRAQVATLLGTLDFARKSARTLT